MRLRSLLFAGMLAGLAMVLQTAPVWLGEPVGFALAILASLPIAVAAAITPRDAAPALLVAALLCTLVQPEEGWIFGLTNGPFGLALGAGSRRGDVGWSGLLPPALTLFFGLSLLTWAVGFAALGPELVAHGLPVALGGYLLFALTWSALFTPTARLLVQRVRLAMERWSGPTTI